jgi:histidinol-phosphate aminotransferase
MPLRLPDSLADLHSYVPGKPIEEVQREFGLPEVVKLASNENPLGPSPLAIKAIAESAQFAHLYPDVGCVELKSALSEHIGMPTTQIAVGNGSDEFIHLISLVLLKPGDSIVMADPGFSRYESEAIVAGAETRKVPLNSEARHDLRSARPHTHRPRLRARNRCSADCTPRLSTPSARLRPYFGFGTRRRCSHR